MCIVGRGEGCENEGFAIANYPFPTARINRVLHYLHARTSSSSELLPKYAFATQSFSGLEALRDTDLKIRVGLAPEARVIAGYVSSRNLLQAAPLRETLLSNCRVLVTHA